MSPWSAKGTSMWAEQAGEGSRGQRDDGGKALPQMALRLPSSERKPALFPHAYLMLWLEKQARAGVRVASPAHLRDLISLRAADIRLACGFFCGFRITGCPGGCYFCPCLGTYDTVSHVGHRGPMCPAPLRVFSAWNKCKGSFKCSKCPRGVIMPSK